MLAGGRTSGTPGLIPHAEFFVASVFVADTQGDSATDTISVLKALDWMDAFNVKLINMSFAGPKDELVQKAIEKLSAKGVVFIAAVGNEGPTAEPSYPAAYKQVIAVTAVNRELRGYHYANRGEHIDVAEGVGGQVVLLNDPPWPKTRSALEPAAKPDGFGTERTRLFPVSAT